MSATNIDILMAGPLPSGMGVTDCNATPKPDPADTVYADAESLARDADVLVLTLPGEPRTPMIVNGWLLDALGPPPAIASPSPEGRSSIKRRRSRRSRWRGIGGAGLEMFDDEPRVPAGRLTLDNVVLTPHLASGAHDTRRAMSELAFAKLHAYVTGQPVLTPVH